MVFKTLVALVIGAVIAFVSPGSFANPVDGVQAQTVPVVAAGNDNCTRWAIELGIEGVVRDSLRMHLLGCDDGANRSKHYTRIDAFCASVQRSFVKTYGLRPYKIRDVIRRDYPQITIYEDGTCSHSY